MFYQLAAVYVDDKHATCSQTYSKLDLSRTS